jgi:hypothetical protein
MAHSDTLWSVLARVATATAEKVAPVATTSTVTASYPNDPVGFARDVLRMDLTRNQKKILRAFADFPKVSVCSGHKVGKSTIFAVAALWFYCSYANARIVITAVTDRQVNGIIWREIKRLAKRACIPIPGADQSVKRALTGWDHPDNESEIRGYTAAEAEGIAGVSGAAILYLVDEASGVAEYVFEAIFGNRAGGQAKVGMISNPTKAEGQFYRSHHSERKEVMGEHGWFNLQIPSTDSPNITGEWRTMQQWDGELEAWVPRTTMVPGLAMPGWPEECAALWGEDDARYKIRVLGEFSAAEEAKAFQLALIEEAQARYDETLADGRLYVSCDPAGEGGQGDDIGFCARRGKRVLELRERRKLSEAGIMTQLEELMIAHEQPGDRDANCEPIIVLDGGGDIGTRVHAHVKAEAMRRKHHGEGRQFWVVRSLPALRATREPTVYELHRDELVANARNWMREGGAIPKHARLEDELHAGEFTTNVHDRLQFTRKEDLRKILGRSPDVFDAFCLSCWIPRFAQRAADDISRQGRPPTANHPVTEVHGGENDAGYGDPYRSSVYGGGYGSPYGN